MTSATRRLPSLMIAGGALLSVTSVLADRLGFGSAGMSAAQLAMLIVGGLSMIAGIALTTDRGTAWLENRSQYLKSTQSVAGVMILAAFFGLISGWGQVGVLFVRRNLRHEMIGMGLDYPWLIPLMSLGLFLMLGLLLRVAQAQWPQSVSRPVVVGILAFAAFLSVLLMTRHIHRAALAILATGLAVQTARIAARRHHFVNQTARFITGWPALFHPPPDPDEPERYPSRRDFVIGTGAAIGAVAIGVRVSDATSERRAIAHIPAVSKRPPDVLLLVLDTARASSLSLHGYAKPTSPNLERLATRALTFRRAIAPASWTLPSHASMFTGRWPRELSTGPWSALDATYPTLAEYLRDQGYLTAGFVANREYCGREFGLSRGFVHYEDFRTTPGQGFLYTSFGKTAMEQSALVQSLRTYDNFGRKSAEQLATDFLRWRTQQTGSQPIFAFLNYWDAHDPYTPPKAYAARFAPPGTRGGAPPTEPPDPEELAALQGHYDAGIAYADAQVGVLMDELERQGILENTLLIVLSDHGEHFGEHGLMLHGGSLYTQEIHVPLLIAHPGLAPAASEYAGPVSLRNLPATVVDLLGLSKGAPFPGQSLRTAWETGSYRDPVVSEADRVQHLTDQYPAAQGRLTSLVRDDLHYIRRESDGSEELYNVATDPEELENLATTDEASEDVAAMQGALQAALAT